MRNVVMRPLLVGTLAVLSYGCAVTEEEPRGAGQPSAFEQSMRNDLDIALQQARQALEEAQSARLAAQEALRAVQEAQDSANACQARCEAVEAQIERAFQQSQSK